MSSVLAVQVTLDDMFTQWYDGLMAEWSVASTTHRATVQSYATAVMQALASGADVTADVAVAAAVKTLMVSRSTSSPQAFQPVQVIDPTTFPNNPSCPFP